MTKLIKRALSLFFAVSILLIAFYLPSSANGTITGQAQVTDGSFESGTIGKKVDGWSLASTINSGREYNTSNNFTSNYILSIGGEGYKGKKSLCIEGKNGTRGYVVAESDYICVESGAEYFVSYAIKIDNVESTADFYGGKALIYQFDKDGKQLDKGIQLGIDMRADMDWEYFCSYMLINPNVAFVKVAFYVGGSWNKNSGIRMFVDEVSVEKLGDSELLNGDFEIGDGKNDIFSWHMTSKTIFNEATTNNWARNFSMVRDTNGYHGDCVAITRNGIGYISLDSNMIKASPDTTYVLDFAVSIENSVYANFPGFRAYIAEYDKDKKLIQTTPLHTAIREDIPWTEMSNAMATGTNTAYIQIQLWCAGSNDLHFTVRLDDVRLTKVIRNISKDGINNGNFEEVLDGTIFDWILQKRDDVAYQSTFEGYNNSKGLKVIRTSKDKQGFASIKSNIFNVAEGKDYKLTYMSRFEKQEGTVYMAALLSFKDANNKVIEQQRTKEFDHRTNSNEWLQEVGYFTAPKGSVTCQLEFLVAGISYECWLDDVVWSTRDNNADVYGFDAVDDNGNLAGWTVTQPGAAKLDKKTFRQGTSSLFVSQTTKIATCKVVSDVKIPVEPQTRYKFSIYVKNYGCDVTSDGMALHAYAYDKDGNYLRRIVGNKTVMNCEKDPSNWRELICGVNTKFDVAYVRLYLEVGAGTMNFWVDDLKWKVYSSNDEFADDFDIVDQNGTPDGWDAVALGGKPKFITKNSFVSIQAADGGDTGIVSAKWNTAQQYSTMDSTLIYRTTANTEATLSIKFYDYANNEFKDYRVEKTLESTYGTWSEYTFKFVSAAMVYAKIELGNKGTGTVDFDSISIVSQEDDEGDPSVIDWRGKWIWYPEDNYACTNSTRYFRTHLSLPDTPEEGSLQITADDKIKLWVNDVEVDLGDEGSTWDSVSIVEDLQEYFIAGDNTIAMQASNDSSAAALLFDGYILTENGEWIDFYSDENVVSAINYVEGWNEVGFNDSKWLPCQIIGNVGMSPWGIIDFDSTPYINNVFEIESYEITENVNAGGEATLKMTVIPEEDITSEIGLRGSIWVRNSNTKVLDLELKHTEGPAFNKWKAGKKITVSYSFPIMDYMGSGKYILQLDVNQVRITNTDIMNNKLKQAIVVTNDISKTGVTTHSEIKNINGSMAFVINGKAYPAAYYSAQRKSYYSGAGPAEEYMCNAGLCITRISPYLGGNQYLPAWKGDGEYDFSSVDQLIYDALADHLDTYLMLNIYMDVPTWWAKQNPDEMILLSNGNSPGVSFASDKFQEDALAANVAMMKHVMKQPYANRIMGIHLSGCNTSEWLWYSEGQNAFDYSKAAVNKWREWLKAKYGTDAELQKAWNRKNVTLETAEVPTIEERAGKTYQTILDPAIQKDCIDYNIFAGEIVADRLVATAEGIAKSIDDRLFIGAYYGYIQNTKNFSQLHAAHSGVERVLESKYIDYFLTPVIYGERDDGEAAQLMTMTDSVRAHGKFVMGEGDIRTCTYVDLNSNFYQRDEVGPTYNVSDTLSQMERSFSMQLTSNVGDEWMNLGGNYWENEQFSELIEIMCNERLVDQAMDKEYENDICYIMDEDMPPQMTHKFNPTQEYFLSLQFEQRFELSRIGVSLDTYYMSDLEKGLVPDHKIYIMVSPIEVDKQEKEAIEKYLKKDNHVIVWICLSGVSDGKKISAKSMSDLIGINVSLDNTARSLGATISNKKHWLTDGLQGTFFGNRTGVRAVSPTGIVNDSRATVLGYMYDNPSQPALAIKEMGNWTSIYSAVTCLPTELIRNLLKKCDIHTYSENRNDVIFADNHYVAVNTAYGGEREIKLDGTYAVYDVFDKTTYSLSTDVIKITMEDNSTKLFRLTPTDKHVVYVHLGEHGSSKQEGYNEVRPGKDYQCKITADDGYIISAIKIDGATTEVNDKSYKLTFEDLDNSHFVKAEFSRVNEGVEVIGKSIFPTWIFWVIAGAVILTSGAIITLIIFYKKRRNQNEKVG